MSYIVTQISMFNEDSLTVDEAADAAMTPQAIVDALSRIDPDDLRDVLRGLSALCKETT